MKLLRLLLTFSIVITSLLGDYVVFRSKYSQSQLFRAVADSAVHASIGFLSACLFFSTRLNIPLETCIYNTIFCTFMSSLIDIDHVFVAKSIYLKDLTNLKHRGIFHCTTFWLLIMTILLTYSYLTKRFNLNLITHMLIIAVTSHHIRDANRRGLWMYPYGHTSPIHTYVYVTSLAILPYVFSYSFTCMKQLKDYTLIETV